MRGLCTVKISKAQSRRKKLPLLWTFVSATLHEYPAVWELQFKLVFCCYIYVFDMCIVWHTNHYHSKLSKYSSCRSINLDIPNPCITPPVSVAAVLIPYYFCVPFRLDSPHCCGEPAGLENWAVSALICTSKKSPPQLPTSILPDGINFHPADISRNLLK